MDHNKVIQFWFKDIQPKMWWVKDIKFDQLIIDSFKPIHLAASKGELAHWRDKPLGRLAEIIVLDQFSRNIFRDTRLAFAQDSQALCLSQEAIRQNTQAELNTQEKMFLFIPFMHSESNLIHEQAVNLFSEPGLESNYDFELKHKAIIDKFGRYPHRNEILERESTDAELEFLKQPGSSF